MSLRSALAALPDDRMTRTAVTEILAYMTRCRSEAVGVSKVASVTGIAGPTVQRILDVLAGGVVLECSGDPPVYRYREDTVNDLEVSRFLRSKDAYESRVQVRLDKFRGRRGMR